MTAIPDLPESEQRAAIVAAARSWSLTPYANGQDVKGAGVDCGMLLVRVFVDLGLVPPFDPRPYPQDWHLHRSEEKYLGWVRAFCGEVAAPAPGDIVLFRFGRCYSHGGIVTASHPLAMVHAFVDARCVVEEAFAQNPRVADPERKPIFFSLWAKSGAA